MFITHSNSIRLCGYGEDLADGNVTLFIDAGVCYLVNGNVNLILDSGFFKVRPPLPVENFREYAHMRFCPLPLHFSRK